ncbi:protein KRI1 homolog [Plectropomus leopardus]|uniref:protein KRI1 homolog n=1 Tax=Plectropomus leopardus TaxID=160734 RepID=UPI001C4C1772|nr:protein KRI1 homolog [Plectropomus leopardus]
MSWTYVLQDAGDVVDDAAVMSFDVSDLILNADDKELNQWCSLKKTCMFRSEKEEMSDLKNYKIKAKNEKKKKEVLSSVYSEEDRELTEAKTKVGKKRRDRMKDAETRDGAAEDGDAVVDSADEKLAQALREAAVEEEDEEDEVLIPKKKMKREEQPQTELSAAEAAGESDEVKTRTERPKWSKKKHKRAGGRLASGSHGVKIGGREFSRQRLKAYGLNPKRLFFRQLGRQRRKEQVKKEKQKKKE